jgi:predicted GTPase
VDSPGYEQVNRTDYRDQLLDCAREADLLLLVTPALDPALQMDADLLHDMREEVPDLPAITALTQVDRLRPLREWQPPYDWQWGSRPKEISIREATRYRQEQLGELCNRICPSSPATPSALVGMSMPCPTALIELIDPAKELRLARFLRDRETKITASARLIDRYRLQMSTTQGSPLFSRALC